MSEWWQTMLSTLAGALVGGFAVVGAEWIRSRSMSRSAEVDWHRQRMARRHDEQRAWLIQAQEASQKVNRLSARVMLEDSRNIREARRDGSNLEYGQLSINEELNTEMFVALVELNHLASRLSDEAARSALQRVRRKSHEVQQADRAASARAALMGAQAADSEFNDRLTTLLDEL